MRITEFFLLIIGGGLLQAVAPWFALGLLAALVGYGFRQTVSQAFITGFLAGFFLWAGYAGYLHFLNEGILGDRMGKLFGGIDGWALVAVTGILGGILAGVGCWTGQALRQLLQPRLAAR